jgi:hypothetical protein
VPILAPSNRPGTGDEMSLMEPTVTDLAVMPGTGAPLAPAGPAANARTPPTTRLLPRASAKPPFTNLLP